MKKMNNGRLTLDPVDALRADLSSIKRDLASLVGSGVDSVTERTTEAFTNASDAIKETMEHAQTTAAAAHRKLGKVTGARPIATIAIAAAAGAIAVKLLGRMLRD